jgi:radical SAM enzyme (TIGR01210 family)
MARTIDQDLTRPVAVWRSRDLLKDRPVESLTVILRTKGCRWRRCTMCGYAIEGAPSSAEDLIAQFRRALQSLSPEVRMIKIYTSGSFLDSGEVPLKARDMILNLVQSSDIERLVVESRPEHITSESIGALLSYVQTEFAIGLETSNDLIRTHAIGKGFSFQEFVAASHLVHDLGGFVKAYLLLKPPLLSEAEAIRDAIASAREARGYADILSLNLCNVQRDTTLERLWEQGGYRPPWLWSAVEVLQKVDRPVICDPVGAGSRRGPHNCGRCDKSVAEAIRRHNLSQDPAVFETLHCDCREAWQRLRRLEGTSFGSPLGDAECTI